MTDSEDLNGFAVLMAVYYKSNADQFDEALKSIWDDQSLKPDQIVVVLDGAVNIELQEVLKKWEKRIPTILTIVALEKNSGLASALNYGLDFCRYDLIARMDADDISLPVRFAFQIHYLSKHEDLKVLGGQVEEWSDDMKKLLSKREVPISSEAINKFAKYRCPINHPSVCFRKQVIKEVGGYPLAFPEDYSLWVKLIQRGYRIENLPTVILKMRSGEMLKKRRGGFEHYICEVRLFERMRQESFISSNQFILNIMIRLIVRLGPFKLRKFLYTHCRKVRR